MERPDAFFVAQIIPKSPQIVTDNHKLASRVLSTNLWEAPRAGGPLPPVARGARPPGADAADRRHPQHPHDQHAAAGPRPRRAVAPRGSLGRPSPPPKAISQCHACHACLEVGEKCPASIFSAVTRIVFTLLAQAFLL